MEMASLSISQFYVLNILSPGFVDSIPTQKICEAVNQWGSEVEGRKDVVE
jgi:hypothetical protein